MRVRAASRLHYLFRTQYGLEIPDESKERLREVIARFDSKKDIASPYAAQWMEKNGKKLLLSAIDVVRTVQTLDELGLREKLVRMGDPEVIGSLAYWRPEVNPLVDHVVGAWKGAPSGHLIREAHEKLRALLETMPEYRRHPRYEHWRQKLPALKCSQALVSSHD